MFWVPVNLLPENGSNLDYTKILLSQLTLYQTTKFKTAPNSKHVQDDNKSEWKFEICFVKGKKALWEKEKMVVTSIFSFSHYVFKAFSVWGH